MNLKIYLQKLIMCCCILFAARSTFSQSRPPVLILKGDNQYTTHFDTQNKLTSQLLNAGLSGQATVEFWVMKAHTKSGMTLGGNGTWKLSTLTKGAQAFSLEGIDGQLVITTGAAKEVISLAGADGFWNNHWRHIAFTINKEAQSLRVYVDGVQQANLAYPTTDFTPEQLYMMVTEDDQLSIAEYRAWNRVRNADQILEGMGRTFANDNAQNLERLGNNGLVVVYGNDNFSTEKVSNLPLMQTKWNNMISSSLGGDHPTEGRVTSSLFNMHEEEFVLAELTSNADHPIYSLTDVMLYASDGEGRNASGAIVKLRWPHLANATNYVISRRNLADPSSSFTDIATMQPTSNNPISSYLTYEDSGVLPNELYEYQVIADGVVGSKPGVDNGFVFANGVAHGEVKTATEIATQDALLEAETATGSIPGAALEFLPSSSPVKINDVSLFEIAEGFGTIEFWYRTPVAGSGTNTIFKLSDGEIRISESTIQVVSRNPQNQESTLTYLQTAKPTDTEWHHYAVTFSPTGGALFVDGGVKQPTNKENPVVANATTQLPFVVGLGKSSSFSFNARAESNYQLDEVRIWSTKRNATEIYKNWKYFLGATTASDLMAYYRFDMRDAHNIYNQSAMSLGRFRGVSLSSLKTVAQPYRKVQEEGQTTNVPLTYAVYTDHEGRYRFTSLNSGRQSQGTPVNYLAYRIRPAKPNNEFSPEAEITNIERSLNPEEPGAISFTNISAYDISGKVVYLTTLPGQSEKVEFPTIQSTGIKLDGTEVTSTEPGALVRTNNQGVFRISGAPGRHRIEVGQPQFEDASIDVDRVSLDFKGDGYAVTKSSVEEVVGQGFTLSGFMKPDMETEATASGESTAIPEVQAILQWGTSFRVT